ncbi:MULTISPECIES: hypothetical protein [unclassified Actinomyces]|uniref:hypothetical protein n=1 Tax=unclassified Actinomyces TaxID=2609248 RepID=UPI0013742F24|nr:MULTISPECIES: hypothetical protein [unclassified Actinomyces]MBW3069299.1 hypothetical protein [Actinomyces sp. 594]NDR52860.1 hypothetical protein [Actinomyces sp. 565]QHO91353.1 hypothetical protein CWT12_08555 [Actinomyces sp. 432]
MTSPRTPRRPSARRATRALALALCLTSGLALAACGSGSGKASESTAASGGSGLSLRASTQEPIPTLTPTPTPSPSSGVGLSARSSEAPPSATPQQTEEPWSPPTLKFYNEDTSVWYQDDSVVNTDAVSSNGNIEGYRTWDNACIGYETRDISERIHDLGLDDDTMSSLLVPVNDSVITDYNETGRETLDLVRDDGGTMEGYSVTWTGTFNYDDGTTESVEGYKFARAVGNAGLDFSVEIICSSGRNVSAAQWHTILSGIRIEGLKAGKMSS